MDREAVLALIDYERRSLVRTDEITEIEEFATVRRALDGRRCMVEYSRFPEEMADREIRKLLDRMPADFEWKLFSHDLPADLPERLRAAGLVQGEQEAVMVFDTSFAPPWSTSGDVRRVRTREELTDFRTVAEAVFQKDYSLTTRELSEAIAAGSYEHVAFVAYSDSAPVSIGRVYTHPESVFAGLYGGGTLSEYRGRGFYRAVVAARAAFAFEKGSRFLNVDALPTSRPTLERLGFERVAWTWPYYGK